MDHLLPGTRVRMSRRLRTRLRWSGSREHVREFGRSVGIVSGPAEGQWPEDDVFWGTLKYCYAPEDLEIVPDWHKEKK